MANYIKAFENRLGVAHCCFTIFNRNASVKLQLQRKI